MSNASDAARAIVVHIRAGEPGESKRMDVLLSSFPARIICWTDVYRGLARLGHLAKNRAEADCLNAIVVDVSALGAAEMDFFSLFARLWPHVPVLVYGPAAAAGQIDGALAHGAASVATPEAIARFVVDRKATEADLPEVSSPAREPSAPGPVVAIDHVSDAQRPAVPRPADEPTCTESANREMAAEGEDDPAEDDNQSPPRVPWLRYGDSPSRRAPSRVPPRPVARHDLDMDAEGDRTDDRRDSDAEPLLTEEELQALIGDDISAIAPRSPAPRRGADDAQEGGES